jgi:3-deoxy-D-manno-octulosonic-acid transferase
MLFRLLLALYTFASRHSSPLWAWALARRLRSGKETKQSVQQKLSLEMPPRPPGALVWGHAVGVGETQALAGLFWTLAERLPNHHFLITSSSNTSGQALQRTGLPPRCQHQFAPVDCYEAVQAFLKHWQPCLALFCEMDLWPTTLQLTRRAGIPMLLLNARTTPKKVAQRARIKSAYAHLLNAFESIYAQNAETLEGLAQLGAARKRLHLGGSIKVLAPVLGCDAQELSRWTALLLNRPVWLLASSHPGEESVALAAHALLRNTHPNALLIIAPRDPRRRSEVAALLESSAPTRNRNEWPAEKDSVYLADTIGEMGLWYRLAPVSLVGGSLAAVGGHNPYEPARLNSFVISGPNIWNFSETYDDLIARNQATVLGEPTSIADCVRQVWTQRSAVPPTDWAPPAPTRQMLEAIVQWAEASN